MLRLAIQNGYKSDPGGPGPPPSIQHRGGHSDKGGDAGRLRPAGGATWTGMGSGGEKHRFPCGQRPHIRTQTHIGADKTDSNVPNVQESWTADEYGKEKGGGFYPGVHMRASGIGDI